MPAPVQPAINGSEARLDLILEELRAIRARIEGYPEPKREVDLKEPAKRK